MADGVATNGVVANGPPPSTTRPAPRARTARAVEIIDTARALLEERGPRALTMRRLAEALGIQAPSLYKHLPSRSALELALVEQGLDEIGAALHAAVAKSAAEPIGVLLDTYRRAGLDKPQLYRLVTATSFPRDQILPGLEAWAGEPFFQATSDSHVAQALWSFAHGTLILELDGRFPGGSDLDRTWQAGANAFKAACGASYPGVVTPPGSS
ncbi:MAG: TetR/AcrR family transcriptional regulator [Acidimicrobiales bacterium]